MKSFFITRRMIAVMLFMLTLSVYFSVNYTTAINMPKTSAAKANKRVPLEYNNFYNASALNPFFEKLVALDTFHDRKINIVHIGDSHIQADVMTNVMRVRLQEVFGNAGLGLVFPYSLIKTNGGKNVSFTSNIAWKQEIGRASCRERV